MVDAIAIPPTRKNDQLMSYLGSRSVMTKISNSCVTLLHLVLGDPVVPRVVLGDWMIPPEPAKRRHPPLPQSFRAKGVTLEAYASKQERCDWIQFGVTVGRDVHGGK